MRPLEQATRLLKMALAAGLSWYLASLVSPHQNPYFAPLAVVITFQSTVAGTAAKAWYRSAGIIGGVAAALLIGHWLHVGPTAIALAVLVGVALSTVLKLDPQITNQVGVTAVMVLASSATPHYAAYRIFETLLGEVVAVAVNALLLPPNELPAAEKQVLALADSLAAILRNLSQAPPEACGTMLPPIFRQVKQQTEKSLAALRAAEFSLKLNLSSQTRRARLTELTRAMDELEKAGIQVMGIARGLDDLGAQAAGYRAGLNEALQDTAEAVAAYRLALADPSPQTFQRVAAAVATAHDRQFKSLSHVRATASLTELRDLGAIFADLDRILAEVSLNPQGESKHAAIQPSVAFGHD